MEALILSLLDRFPNAIVKGHRDMPGAATQCPGFDVGAWWDGVAASREYAASMPLPPVRTLPRRKTWLQKLLGL